MADGTITDTQAGGTSGGDGSNANTQAGGAGGATDASQQNQVAGQQQQQQQQGNEDPQIDAAIALLKARGLWGKQVFGTGHMAAARTSFEREAAQKAQEAANEAARKAAEEQGQFKPLYEQEKTARETAEAKVKRYETALDTRITEAVADWPQIIREQDPGSGDYEKRLTWFESFRKIAEEMLKAQGGTQHGSGWRPNPSGAGGSDPVQAYHDSVYGPVGAAKK